MLASHRYKFIYTKTMKTGGTSVESYFEPFCMKSGEWSLQHLRDEYVSESGIIGCRGDDPPQGSTWWNHMSAAEIRNKIGEEVWSNYYKFCVIRNPFEKAVSAFYGFNDRGCSVELYDWEKERADFESWLQSSGPPLDNDKYQIDGEFCLDDVVRHETLANDLQRVCILLGIPWNPAALQYFKAGFRPQNATIETLYTEKSRMLVETAYEYELNYFNYSFPSNHDRS
jgi:hypothetical protein